MQRDRHVGVDLLGALDALAVIDVLVDLGLDHDRDDARLVELLRDRTGDLPHVRQLDAVGVIDHADAGLFIVLGDLDGVVARVDGHDDLAIVGDLDLLHARELLVGLGRGRVGHARQPHQGHRRGGRTRDHPLGNVHFVRLLLLNLHHARIKIPRVARIRRHRISARPVKNRGDGHKTTQGSSRPIDQHTFRKIETPYQ